MKIESELPAFIRQHLRSVWTLETLLFLFQSPARSWSISELVRELRASDMLVRSNLASLERAGLVVPDDEGRFRYTAASPRLAEITKALAATYQERPVAVVNLISAPDDRLQKLADAFRFKGGDS